MLRTAITEQYGITVPIVSAGMGFIATPSLVSAVSNAGGLGLLAAGASPPPALREAIQITRSMTPLVFGVNFIIENTAFGPLTTEGHIDVCIELKVPLVVFFWHLPSAAWMKRLKSSGIKVWLQVGSLEFSREGIDLGADAIIVQGAEAGGHNRGTAGLFALLPRVAEAIAPVPAIAAGGIADGRGLAAALCLGAAGVCVGTRFVASIEGNAHEEYKRRIVGASEADIARTSIFGPEWPDAEMRVIRNRVVREWAGSSTRTPPPPEPQQWIGTTKLGGQEYRMPKFSAILPTPETTGDFEEMCLAAGESAGLVSGIEPAGDIVRRIAQEAEQILASMHTKTRPASA